MEVARFVITFKSPTGECNDELEKQFQEFEKTLDFWAAKICRSQNGLTVEIEGS